MAENQDEKSQSSLETKKQTKLHWDKMEKEELILQVKKQLMLLQKMKLKCDEFGNKNVSLETLLQEKVKHNEEFKMQLDSVILQKNEDCSRISFLEEENANLSRKIENLEELVDCLTMKQETASTTFQCLQEEIKKIQVKNSELLIEIGVLSAVKEEALELDKVKEELALAHEDKAKIHEKLDCLQKEFEASEKLLNNSILEYKLLEEKHAELQGKWEYLDQEYSGSKETITKLENRVSECNVLLETMMAEKDSLTKQLADFLEIQSESEVLKKDSSSHKSTLIDEAKAELGIVRQELQASLINGETLTQKIKDSELINENLQGSNMELKNEYQKVNEKYLESLEKLKDLNISVLKSKQQEEEMSSKIETFTVTLQDYNLIESQLQEMKNNEVSLSQTVVLQQDALEEILQFALTLNSGNHQLKELADGTASCMCTRILNLLREYVNCVKSINASNDAHDCEIRDEDKAGLNIKLGNVEMHSNSIKQKIDSLQCHLESLDAKVAVLESVVPNERASVACQTEVAKRPEMTSKCVSTEVLLDVLDASAEVSELIEKSAVGCQTDSIPVTSKCVSTESLLHLVDMGTEVSELIEACTVECQTVSIPMTSKCVSTESLLHLVDVGTEVSKLTETFTVECQTVSVPGIPEEQLIETNDASTETSQGQLDNAIEMCDAFTEPSKELLPITGSEFCDGQGHDMTELGQTSKEESSFGTSSNGNYHEEYRKWTAEKEAYNAKLLDYARQLKHEKVSIEQSLRTILQCITETELDDNENSDINANLSRLKLLLDGISVSTTTAEDLEFPYQIDHLGQISEVVSLFEGVLLLKVQKWTTCFQTLNASMAVIEGQCNDLQKIADEKEKSAKNAEELVSKYKSIAIKVKKETAELKKKSADVGAELDKTVSECEHYKSQVERTSGQLAVLNKEKSAAEDSAKALETQLAQEKEKHKQTLSRLELAKKEANQSNLMSLEFADYERLITDLNKQLELKNTEVGKFQKEVEFLKEKIQGFQVQIELLESQKEQSELRGEQLRNVSIKLKSEITELRKLEGEWMVTESTLMVRLESLSRDVENYKMQIADIAAENQKLHESRESIQDVHQKAVRLLENRITVLTDDLQKVKNEYTSCQVEFENYKVRAHSVLKDKKSKSTASDTEASRTGTQNTDVNFEEKRRMEKAVEILQGRVQELVAQLNITRTELDTLQEEHDNLLQRHNNLALHQNELDVSWKQRVERLQKELMNERQEHANTVRNLQQQQQLSLNNSLKQQLDALRDEHKQQLEELQLKLDVSNDEIVRLQKELAEVRLTSSTVLTRDDDLMVDFLNTERQEGEGSEFTDNVFGTPQKMSTSGTTGFLPFDQLLNQDKFSNSSIGSAEIEKLEGQLSVAAKRIEHLTEILHESEATNARMTEQTRVLKEEIRRLERNQEREQHLANMEYVKNIIVKFFSLPSGDERERLVPVLTTILRLSPDEEHQVQVIAKGGVLDTQAAAGWSSYLPMWPRTT